MLPQNDLKVFFTTQIFIFQSMQGFVFLHFKLDYFLSTRLMMLCLFEKENYPHLSLMIKIATNDDF